MGPSSEPGLEGMVWVRISLPRGTQVLAPVNVGNHPCSVSTNPSILSQSRLEAPSYHIATSLRISYYNSNDPRGSGVQGNQPLRAYAP